MRKVNRLPQMMVQMSVLMVACLSLGCGPAQTTKTRVAAVCPGSIWPTYHEAFIESRGPLPDKVSVILNGQLKYNECAIRVGNPNLISDVDQPSIVRVQREKGGLRVIVRHVGAYRELPKDFDFEVQDLGGCTKSGKVFFAASNVPLDFKTDYPNGRSCGARTSAKVVLKRN